MLENYERAPQYNNIIVRLDKAQWADQGTSHKLNHNGGFLVISYAHAILNQAIPGNQLHLGNNTRTMSQEMFDRAANLNFWTPGQHWSLTNAPRSRDLASVALTQCHAHNQHYLHIARPVNNAILHAQLTK